MSNDPSKALPAVEAMRRDWNIVDSLLGGTKAMRAASEKFLPKWPKEDAESYKVRLGLSTLLPAFSETVQNMAGRVFAEPIVMGEDTPEQIEEQCQNIDQQGNNLQVWAQDFFKVALSHGLCHALVDFPKADGLRTRADEIQAGVRPYVVMIKPERVIGWRSAVVNGAPVLTQLRFYEIVQEDEGEFGVKEVEQIRVLMPGSWMTYRKNARDEWILGDEGQTSLDVIPLVTYYTKRTGFMTATPPLLELAHLNVKHWQSQSDQDNILHIARVPMLMVSGIDDEQYELKVGTSTATKLPTGADMKWVEHTGKAIEAGRTSLEDLVDDMRLAGAKLLQKEKQATKTATQAEEEAAQEMSPLETMAGQFEDAIDQILQLFARWQNMPEGGHSQVNGNFDIDYNTAVTLPVLVNMAAQGRLSDETLFAEVKRRGVLNPDLDWAEEKQRIADQGPALGVL